MHQYTQNDLYQCRKISDLQICVKYNRLEWFKKILKKPKEQFDHFRYRFDNKNLI